LSDGTSGGAITPGSDYELLNYQNVNYTYINDTHLSSISGMDINGGQSTYQLSYDALGRCVARVLTGSTSSTTYYIYDGEKAILEYHSWSSPSAANVYGRGIDEILMRTDYSPNRTIYYQDDHEGSVTHLTDSSGAVIESYRYDAFGKPTINGGALTASAYGNRFMFTGREYVSQFGIYEYRNRAYHPGLGRFMSEDPNGFGAGDNNFFRYCGNGPLNATDPMGLSQDSVKLSADQENLEPGQRDNSTATQQTERVVVTAPETAKSAEPPRASPLQQARDSRMQEQLRGDFDRIYHDGFSLSRQHEYRGSDKGSFVTLNVDGSLDENVYDGPGDGISDMTVDLLNAVSMLSIPRDIAALGIATMGNLAGKAAFTAAGKLSQNAVSSSKMIIPASKLGNPKIPSGFAKYTTQTLRAPSGQAFQTHFYMNPATKQIYYHLDYKSVFTGLGK
jgi:RHS repeat-associated protein